MSKDSQDDLLQFIQWTSVGRKVVHSHHERFILPHHIWQHRDDSTSICYRWEQHLYELEVICVNTLMVYHMMDRFFNVC